MNPYFPKELNNWSETKHNKQYEKLSKYLAQAYGMEQPSFYQRNQHRVKIIGVILLMMLMFVLGYGLGVSSIWTILYI